MRSLAQGPQGPVPHGPVPNGPVPHGPVPHGPGTRGPLPQGALPQSAAPLPPLCHVTIVAPRKRVDLALPVDIPLPHVMPGLLRAVDEIGGDNAAGPGWVLQRLGGAPFDLGQPEDHDDGRADRTRHGGDGRAEEAHHAVGD
ncbi:MAG: hypothetical protein K0R62_6799, partial [Nonomuraea muscovyensis]|nr:hypothetical protein [Nonomuraea muscovyensis]